MQVEYLQVAVLILLAFWSTGAVFHYNLLPALDKKSRESVLDFIFSVKGLKIRQELALPDVYILPIQYVAGVDLMTPKILEVAGIADFYVERYHKTWNRILIA